MRKRSEVGGPKAVNGSQSTGGGFACPECGGKVIAVGMTECPRCHAHLEIDPEAAEYEKAERAAIAEEPGRPIGMIPNIPKLPEFSFTERSAPVVGVSESETVSATWGEELFTPKQFNSFRVGPFNATTRVRAGETLAQAILRLNAELEVAAAESYERKKREYLKRLNGLVRASVES